MKLFVVGNVTEDIVLQVEQLPSPGETLIAADRLVDIGGKGLNQAIIASRCNVPVQLIAPIGEDDAGARAQVMANVEPLDTSFVKVDAPTDQSIIAVSGDGENTIISSAFAANALEFGEIDSHLTVANSGDFLLMQGNLSQATTQSVLCAARDRGLITYLNPSPIQWSYADIWPLVHTVLMNRTELAQLSGQPDIEGGINKILSAGVTEVLVTSGPKGAHFAADKLSLYQAAAPTDVVDTAGAGDTFCGTFVGAMMRRHSRKEALAIAALAASFTVARRGTHSAFPTVSEMRNLLGPQRAEY